MMRLISRSNFTNGSRYPADKAYLTERLAKEAGYTSETRSDMPYVRPGLAAIRLGPNRLKLQTQFVIF